MFNVPLNHKTVFLFDHSLFFANSCEQQIEFDVSVKSKTAQPQPQNVANFKLNPLNKTLWTCNIESAIEFSRIVYDLFPENKLIQMMVTKLDTPLNSWNQCDQGLDHVREKGYVYSFVDFIF
jgi:hypothetical protein